MKQIQKLYLLLIGAILLATNAHAGRWIQRDPMDVPEHMERDPHGFDFNNYTFVGNSPVNRVDPLGLWWWDGDLIQIGGPQLLHDIFVGDPKPITFDPNSYLANRGTAPLVDENGNKVRAGDLIQNAVVNVGIQVGMAAVGGSEEEGAYLAAEKALAKAAKCEQKLLNPAINATKGGMQHVLERHIINGIPEFAAKSKFITGADLTKLIEQGTQMPMAQQANGYFARVFDAGQIVGIDRASGNATSIVTIITKANGDLVTMFPGRP